MDDRGAVYAAFPVAPPRLAGIGIAAGLLVSIAGSLVGPLPERFLRGRRTRVRPTPRLQPDLA